MKLLVIKIVIGKTQQLFNSKGLKSMISVGDMKAVSNQLQTTNGGLSKGSAVLSSMYKKRWYICW
jgi:hypothetical protein